MGSVYMKKRFLLILPVFLLLLDGYAQSDTIKYLFMGHTYQFYTPGNKMDERIERMDLSGYEGIWLGGDVCSEATLEYETIEYVNNIINLRHPNSHWALGNHDARNGNWQWIEEFTGQKTYYTSHYKGITYMVLNTNITPYDCEQLNDQYRIITTLCDTIKNSSHLVFLVHHGIWHDVPGLPSPFTYAQSNLRFYSFTCNDNKATYATDIYPRLAEVQKRGVQVISILGDMGHKKVEFVSDDGLIYLGTGLNRSKYQDPEERIKAPKDWILEFKHVPGNRWLDWQFHDIDSIVGN